MNTNPTHPISQNPVSNKPGQHQYRWAIPTADDLYDRYLDELIEEGLI